MGHRLGAERLPQLLVPALPDQMQVELAEGGQETVRVVDLVDVPAVDHPQRVHGNLRQRQDDREQAAALGHHRGALAVDHHAHRVGVRSQRPEGDPARHRMRAQQRVRVVMGAEEQTLTVGGVQGRGRGARLCHGGQDGAGRLGT